MRKTTCRHLLICRVLVLKIPHGHVIFPGRLRRHLQTHCQGHSQVLWALQRSRRQCVIKAVSAIDMNILVLIYCFGEIIKFGVGLSVSRRSAKFEGLTDPKYYTSRLQKAALASLCKEWEGSPVAGPGVHSRRGALPAQPTPFCALGP